MKIYEKEIIKPSLQNYKIDGIINWDGWLLDFESNLKELGYIRYSQNHRNEDFCYWKTFKNSEDKICQVGVLFYDFRKYSDRDSLLNRIGIMYQCMLLCDDRIDMDVTKDIDLPEFELMAKQFYDSMSKFINKR
jgi:hypothetical protein